MTRNVPNTGLRGQIGPVSVRCRTYTDAHENRGNPRDPAPRGLDQAGREPHRLFLVRVQIPQRHRAPVRRGFLVSAPEYGARRSRGPTPPRAHPEGESTPNAVSEVRSARLTRRGLRRVADVALDPVAQVRKRGTGAAAQGSQRVLDVQRHLGEHGAVDESVALELAER